MPDDRGCGRRKTAHFLYPNIEYACASGMSFLTTDTKGDLFRNYAGIAEKYYGYQTSILDLRNPTRSEGNNILTLVNKYMDIYLEERRICRRKQKRKNMPRSLRERLSVQMAHLQETMARMHISMMLQKGF